jgi:uncharacterized protein YoxC
MVTAVQAAAMIAAISLAVLAFAGVYAAVKLGRLISEVSRTVTGMRADTDTLLARANAAVDQAHEQLTRTDAITANLDEVGSSIADLTADMSALTGAVRTLVGGPLGRLAGLAYGVRRAIALRRAGPRASRGARATAGRNGRPVTSGTTGPQSALPPASAVVPAQRRGDTGRMARGRTRKVAP